MYFLLKRRQRHLFSTKDTCIVEIMDDREILLDDFAIEVRVMFYGHSPAIPLSPHVTEPANPSSLRVWRSAASEGPGRTLPAHPHSRKNQNKTEEYETCGSSASPSDLFINKKIICCSCLVAYFFFFDLALQMERKRISFRTERKATCSLS